MKKIKEEIQISAQTTLRSLADAFVTKFEWPACVFSRVKNENRKLGEDSYAKSDIFGEMCCKVAINNCKSVLKLGSVF